MQTNGFHLTETFLKGKSESIRFCFSAAYEGRHYDNDVIRMRVIASSVAVLYNRTIAHKRVHSGTTVGGVILAIVTVIGIYVIVRKRKKLSYESVKGVTRSAPNTRSSSPKPVHHLQNRSKSTCLALDRWKEYENDISDSCTSSDEDIRRGTVPTISLFLKKDTNCIELKVICINEITSSEEPLTKGVFVNIFLYDGNKEIKRQQTKTIDRSNVITFNETLYFQLKKRSKNYRIRISAYRIDRDRIRHELGHQVVPLEEIEDERYFTTELLPNLQLKDEKKTSEIEVSLMLTTNSIIIQPIRVIDGLPTTSEAYFKLTLFEHGHKKDRLLTEKKHMKELINLEDTYEFQISLTNLEDYSIRLDLIESLTEKERLIGRVTIGSYQYARGSGLEHWQDTYTNFGRHSRMLHKLKR
ncbi:DgyrCDS11966 [Dimorphilus gyrociliatus]|uniref:DgyrCDS11966 n=1 Tax=Dimorphilus gyrociliatus TaxID=2664684 RepID=A0A7I8W569_9ANNE|nr:DgyrCDS11966 [Dimorphilus gyrociliatus]